MATLQTVWELAQTAGEPHSVIRVRNLQTSLKVGKDAWGGEGKLQPVLISATVSLRKPFESASTEDAVTKSTVHYGILSKAILDACTKFSEGNSAVLTLRAFLTSLLVHLTESSPPTIPVIPKAILRSLEVKITLPKASLIGTGVSLTSALTYNAKNDGISAGSSVLALHELRIPTLIGVNPNERLAKQIVVANIQLDPWVSEKDVYNELEEIVVKAWSIHIFRSFITC
jgi:dihydroneopterin aldolase